MTRRAWVDQRALRTHFRTDPGCNHEMDRGAEGIASMAEQLGPYKTGYYAGHFKVRRFPLRRRIMNTDPFAHLVEWGSVKNVAYAPLRRAARALGFKIHEAAKGDR